MQMANSAVGTGTSDVMTLVMYI